MQPDSMDVDREHLLRVFETARRFVACRERADAVAAGRAPVARTLAEAIERDFAGFELVEAERALRAAVIAADPKLASLPAAPARRSAG